MDVTCDRCSTEYEFEEALVSPRGTTVKCTQCGHLFKVFRNESPLPTQLPGTHWTVRRADGSTHELEHLAELTDLVRAGTFTRDDEVSRTGKAWRRLGDIEELEEFFLEADRRGPSRGFPTIADPLDGERTEPLPAVDAEALRALSSVTSSNPPADPPPAVQPPAADDEDDEALTVQRPLPGRPAPAVAPIDVARNTPSGNPRPRRLTPPPAAGARPVFAPSQLTFPDLDSELAPSPRRPAWPWVVATLAIAGGASFWLFSPAPAPAPIHQPPAAAAVATQDLSGQYLASADQAFAAHRVERFEQAITDYIKALAFHDSDAHILSSLSRVYAVWAQELSFSLDTSKARADNDQARSERQQLQKQIQALADQAKNYAESAARKNPGNAEAEVALSDALRLTGSLVAARSELDRARATDHHPSAETLRVSALLSSAEAGGDLRKGLAFASQAVSRDPELLRCRLLLARCLIADGDIQGARYQLHEVTVRDRDHPSVAAIEQELNERAQEPPAAEDPPAKPAAADAPATPVDNLSHDSCVARGQALLESGQVMLAKRMFEQALFLRPNSAAAHTGMGYVALEKGRPQLAAEHFQSAARGGNEDALIGLADAYRRLGRPRDALRTYQNYLNRFPNGKQISIARAQVERLSEEIAARRNQ